MKLLPSRKYSTKLYIPLNLQIGTQNPQNNNIDPMCSFTYAIHTYLNTYKSIWAEIPFSENCYNIFYTFLPHTNTYNVKYIATFIQKSSWDKMASRLKIVFVTGIDSESDFFPPKLSMYIHCAVCLIKIGFLFVGGKSFFFSVSSSR